MHLAKRAMDIALESHNIRINTYQIQHNKNTDVTNAGDGHWRQIWFVTEIWQMITLTIHLIFHCDYNFWIKLVITLIQMYFVIIITIVFFFYWSGIILQPPVMTVSPTFVWKYYVTVTYWPLLSTSIHRNGYSICRQSNHHQYTLHNQV